MNPIEFLLLFFKAAALSFGGLGSLPILQQDLVQIRGWATDAQIAKALAVGRLSPGPNGMFVVSLGYLAMGWPGAVLALLGVMLPPLVVVPLAPLVRRTMHIPWVDGFIRGLVLASSGLLVSVGLGIVLPRGVLTPELLINVALGIFGFVLTRSGKIHPVVVLGGAGAVGVALWLLQG